MNARIIAMIFALVLCSPALAHEFWIEPVAFDVEPGELLPSLADLKAMVAASRGPGP